LRVSHKAAEKQSELRCNPCKFLPIKYGKSDNMYCLWDQTISLNEQEHEVPIIFNESFDGVFFFSCIIILHANESYEYFHNSTDLNCLAF
jgi:hypothetical protein